MRSSTQVWNQSFDQKNSPSIVGNNDWKEKEYLF